MFFTSSNFYDILCNLTADYMIAKKKGMNFFTMKFDNLECWELNSSVNVPED